MNKLQQSKIKFVEIKHNQEKIIGEQAEDLETSQTTLQNEEIQETSKRTKPKIQSITNSKSEIKNSRQLNKGNTSQIECSLDKSKINPEQNAILNFRRRKSVFSKKNQNAQLDKNNLLLSQNASSNKQISHSFDGRVESFTTARNKQQLEMSSLSMNQSNIDFTEDLKIQNKNNKIDQSDSV